MLAHHYAAAAFFRSSFMMRHQMMIFNNLDLVGKRCEPLVNSVEFAPSKLVAQLLAPQTQARVCLNAYPTQALLSGTPTDCGVIIS